ncbi:MAG: TRAP transporter large permease [Anaerolineaceae bacterium]|nr:TRAP transporter large permease [Anaerolineaceae bacterium]
MSQVTIGVLMLFGSLLLLIVLRIPIAFSLGISAVITAVYLDIPLVNLYMKMVTSMQSFVIIAAPFFVVMAQLMSDGGITKKLMRFCNLIVGRIRGGTAIVNIVVSMLFGGISGSSTADVSSIGSMLIPAMIDEGYDADYSIAVTVTSSLEGIMIPPSQNMLFYAVAAGSGLSISTLLICGYLPGVFLTAGLCIPALIIAKKRNYPVSTFETKGEKLKIIFEALAGLMAIVIIVVGTTCGICSATESAAVAAVYALLVSALLYRSLTFKEFVQSFFSALPIMAMSLAIISCSNAFSYVMSYLKVPTMIINAVLSISSNTNVIIALMLLIMIFLGCFMDMGVLIFVTTPILYPLAMRIGINPYHFGVMLVFGFAIGLCTPPVGTSLFLGCKIGKIAVEDSIKAFIPFYVIMLLLLLLFAYVPEISLCLPRALGLTI